MRKTKIVCTLGPATDNPQVLRGLFESGMNVARLNFSHGSHAEHKKRVDAFKAVRNELDVPVALLLDTKGPEIRLKDFKGGIVTLEKGKTFTLTGREVEGSEKIVSITYADLHKYLTRGNKLLIDDGLIELRVNEIEGKDIHCEVINGGIVKDKKSVNVPGIPIDMPYLNEQDEKNILFAAKHDFDFIAASFVRNADCVKQIKKLLEKEGKGDIQIISKIENSEGVANIDEIIKISDGVMVARGDMGVEIPFEELPAIQKKIIRKCYSSGKLAITATQMLDSMINNPRPTRAEITDIANAIYDGTSAIMLSGETSVGKYPLETVATMSKIARETEANIDYSNYLTNREKPQQHSVTEAISLSTFTTAQMLEAQSIVTVTKSGYTARMISKYRPECAIIATTASKKMFYQLALSWGVIPVLTETKDNTDDLFKHAIAKASEKGLIKNGDVIVITGGMPVDVSGTTNTLKVHIVGDILLKGKGVNRLKTSGTLYVVRDEDDDCKQFNVGDILVIKKTAPNVLPILKYASAIVTEEAHDESKAVVVGQVLDVPVIANAKGATKILKSGTVVTVNAAKGQISSDIQEHLRK